MTETATAALRRLAPTAELEEAAYSGAFAALAALLLDGATLHIAGRAHRFTELELYFRGPAHRDPFTHGDALQKQLGRWYFHRAGNSYRSGTYKGLDIAFGSDDAFAGILIRGIAHGETLVDGPCMVVDHILDLAQAPTVDALVKRFDLAIEPNASSPLWIELAPGAGRAIHATARVGLTLKRHNNELGRRFIARSYRFLSEPARIRKGKPHLVVALHDQGRTATEIARLTATRTSVVDGYVRAFEAGRTRDVATFDGDLTPAELCALLGACAGRPRA